MEHGLFSSCVEVSGCHLTAQKKNKRLRLPAHHRQDIINLRRKASALLSLRQPREEPDKLPSRPGTQRGGFQAGIPFLFCLQGRCP